MDTNRNALQEEVDMMKRRSSELLGEIDECLNEIERLRTAVRRAADDDDFILFSPTVSRKRPSREASTKARKRLRQVGDDSDEDSDFT